MNQKCISTIEKLSEIFGNLTDALDMLREAVTDEDEEKVDQSLDQLPTPHHVASALEKLRMLIEHRPWEGRKKKANA